MREATCVGSVVTCEGVPVDADILSNGDGSSVGVLLMQADKVKYLTSNASDIEDLIEGLTTIIEKIIDIATGLDAVTTNPGSEATSITELTTLKAALSQSKELLK